jgi:hypothetical protein
MEKSKQVKQEDIILTTGNDRYHLPKDYFSTDNITNIEGVGDDLITALQDHIIELILYYEGKLNGNRRDLSD